MTWYLDFFDMEYAKHFLDIDEKTNYQVKIVKEAIQHESVQTIFEMCCGVGNLSLELAKLGYEVNANDIIPAYIKEAERKKKEKNINHCFFECSDIKTVPIHKTYDLVLNMYSSFGYEKTKEENVQILQKAYELLKENGVFLMEFYDSDGIIKHFKTNFNHVFEDVTYIRECELTPKNDFMFQNWSVIRHNEVVKTHRSQLWLVKKKEMVEILTNIGFSKVEIKEDHQRIILKAKK